MRSRLQVRLFVRRRQVAVAAQGTDVHFPLPHPGAVRARLPQLRGRVRAAAAEARGRRHLRRGAARQAPHTRRHLRNRNGNQDERTDWFKQSLRRRCKRDYNNYSKACPATLAASRLHILYDNSWSQIQEVFGSAAWNHRPSKGQVVRMFLGHDTTEAAISFALSHLASHPDVQEKILEELKSVFDWSQPLQPTTQQLSELKYLEMVIKEVLRLNLPVPVILRDITEDEKLPSSK
ncbi:Cytochrome P450 [Gryllus bimaculatus]|nr:Cytochrome P450 [Gryllus bimaculatus]